VVTRMTVGQVFMDEMKVVSRIHNACMPVFERIWLVMHVESEL